MFDLSFPALSTPFPADVMPVIAHSTFDRTKKDGEWASWVRERVYEMK